MGDAFDVETVIHPEQDTALFEDTSIIEWAEAADGKKVIVSDIWDAPIDTTVWEAITVSNIRQGWKLCDGANGTRDLRHLFIMSVDPADEAGDGSENEIGDTGGFRWHGQTENNHPDHTKVDVVATIDDHTPAEIVAAIEDHPAEAHFQNHAVGSGDPDVEAFDPDSKIQAHPNHPLQAHAGTGGLNDIPHAPNPGEDDLPHTGPFNALKDTDNRPRFYVLAARQRVT